MVAPRKTRVSSSEISKPRSGHGRPALWKAEFAVCCLFCALIAGCGTVQPVRSPTPVVRPVPPPTYPTRRPITAATWRAAVQSWLGTPYKYGGTDRRGIDCSGFTREMYRSVAGIELPRTADTQFSVGVSVPKSALRPGDLVFFSEAGKGIVHVGLSLGGDEFAHASVRHGVTITSLREPWYAARWCGAKRVMH